MSQIPNAGRNTNFRYLSLTETGQYIIAKNTNTDDLITDLLFGSDDYGATWKDFTLWKFPSSNTVSEINMLEIYFDPTTNEIRLLAADTSRAIVDFKIPF